MSVFLFERRVLFGDGGIVVSDNRKKLRGKQLQRRKTSNVAAAEVAVVVIVGEDCGGTYLV